MQNEHESTDIIRIDHLNKTFGDVKAVNDLSFRVKKGELFAFLGVNGAGKSTTISILCGQLSKDSGTVQIKGCLLYTSYPQEKVLALTPEACEHVEETGLYICLILNPDAEKKAVTCGMRDVDVWLTNKIKKSLRQEYAELLGEEVFDLRVEELSHKQKYDLIYMRILVQNPKVVFCVQPFKRAEVSIRIHVWELLERFLDKGIAVVILAVNLADSLALADRLLRVGKGLSLIHILSAART